MKFRRPANKEQLERLEAVGIIRASRFVRIVSRSREQINIDIINQIHKNIFENAFPEIAGKYREENIKIKGSKHNPPHYSRVPGLMLEANKELITVLNSLTSTEGAWMEKNDPTDDDVKNLEKIVNAAAWIHHKITYIHPYHDGNGRTARLSANLILERFGLIGISVKIEKENKNKYCGALSQIDKFSDYEPLNEIILDGMIDRYDGVAVKYYSYRK